MNLIHRLYCRSGHWRRQVSGLLPWAMQDVPLDGAEVLELGSGPGLTTDWLWPRTGAAGLETVRVDWRRSAFRFYAKATPVRPA